MEYDRDSHKKLLVAMSNWKYQEIYRRLQLVLIDSNKLYYKALFSSRKIQ